MQVVYAKQPFPDQWTSAIFLAGPTPREGGPPSWRPVALQHLKDMGYTGVVMVPESEDGTWAPGPDAYDNQVEWERQGLDMADVVVFWVPRNMANMPGLTTNVEYGRYVASDKVVLGAPEEASSIKYLERMMLRELGVSERHMTLKSTLQAAMARIDALEPGLSVDPDAAPRRGGERCVPLHIWVTLSFQAWYRSQVAAGNRLDAARLLWHFRPTGHDAVFAWVLWVKVWIASEQRWKTNEWVFARSDISTVVLYHWPSTAPDGLSSVVDAEVVLIREFRSPARTTDGMVHELPGGSSWKPDTDPLTTASDEVHEETGLIVQASRFKALGSRQLAATLSSHHAHLFVAELTEPEMAQAKLLAASQAVHGVEEDSERTYVEVTTFRELLAGSYADWSTVGMIAQAILRDE